MRRAGVSESSIEVIRQAFRLLYRRRKSLQEVTEYFEETLDGVIPIELSQLLQFVDRQRAGKLGRAREAVRDTPATSETPETDNRKAA